LLLGVSSPWDISSATLDLSVQKVDIVIEYTDDKGDCPEYGVTSPKHDDRKEHTWRHLDTMQFATQLHGKLPRVRCKLMELTALMHLELDKTAALLCCLKPLLCGD
jgi:transposase